MNAFSATMLAATLAEIETTTARRSRAIELARTFDDAGNAAGAKAMRKIAAAHSDELFELHRTRIAVAPQFEFAELV